MRPMKTLAAAVVAAVPLLGGCYHGDHDDYECNDGEAYYLDAGFAGHHDDYQPRHRHYDHRYHGGDHH